MVAADGGTVAVDPSLRKRVDRWLHSVASRPFRPSRKSEKPRSLLRFIPPEIWALIVEHACLLYYDPLDTSRDLSFFEFRPLSFHLDNYRLTLRLKTTIALVCTQWNKFVRMWLYEFVWIRRASQAKALARTLLMEYVERKKAVQEGRKVKTSSGSFIRRLHIETPVLERCSPADIRSILDFTPSLHIYSDHHSLQRSMFNDCPDPRSTPEELLRLLAHPKLRRLSWTTYGCVPFSERIAPLINPRHGVLNLEYLELNCWTPNPHAVTLESPTDSLSRSSPSHRPPAFVRLPALKTLKVSLDNNTFATLATWDMPALRNLSVLSADFSYTGPGFNSFFNTHGDKVVQLELGHSSSIEKYYLTAPHHNHAPNAALATPVSLATSCPNLKEVICSADAEWHWQSPDWITPHILLPSHPNVELIGIRDIDKRLREDPDFEHTGVTPYFPLFEQLVCLLQRDAFPSLRFVRDLSVDSQEMRVWAAKASVNPSPMPMLPKSPTLTLSSQGFPHPKRILQFWTRVVEKCRERGVWCEDYTGVNLTARSLLRAGLVTDEEAKPETERATKAVSKRKNFAGMLARFR